jgi:hypothetical protein
MVRDFINKEKMFLSFFAGKRGIALTNIKIILVL